MASADMKFMEMAIEEAQKGIESGDGGPFGAVIVKDGNVIAKGHNEVVSSNDPTAHAEITAIRKACKKLGTFSLQGYILYCTGEPCPMCFSAIHWARIERVYYCCKKSVASQIGFDDTEIEEIIRGIKEDNVPFIQQKDNRCEEVMMRWYSDPQRVEY